MDLSTGGWLYCRRLPCTDSAARFRGHVRYSTRRIPWRRCADRCDRPRRNRLGRSADYLMVITQDGSANGAVAVTIPGDPTGLHAIRRILLYRTATVGVVGS